MSFFMRNESLSSRFIQPSRIKLIPRLCQDGPSIVSGYGRAGRSMNILENKPFSHCSIHNNHNNCLPYGGLSGWKFIRDGVRVGVSVLQLIPSPVTLLSLHSDSDLVIPSLIIPSL